MFDRSNFLLPPIPMSAEVLVETPVRRLAEKIGTSPRLGLRMMVDVDFAKDYNNALLHQGR